MDNLDWYTCCDGIDRAEAQTASGGWLRILRDGDTYTVTRYGADKQLTHEAKQMTAKQVAALLAA